MSKYGRVPDDDVQLLGAAVRLAGPELVPVYDPVSHLVYCAGRGDVSDVWVDGAHKMADRVLKDMDISGLDTRAKLWQNALKY